MIFEIGTVLFILKWIIAVAKGINAEIHVQFETKQ